MHNTTQKRDKMSNTTDPSINQRWYHVLAKGKQFLLLKRTPLCYSYSQDVLDTTTRKQARITYIRHQPSYQQLEVKTNRTSILNRNHDGHHNTELRTWRYTTGQQQQTDESIQDGEIRKNEIWLLFLHILYVNIYYFSFFFNNVKLCSNKI